MSRYLLVTHGREVNLLIKDGDVVKTVFGDMSLIARVVYTLVGLSAVYAIFAKKS